MIDAAAPRRTPCPNCISAFEKAVRCFAKNPSENVITPVLSTTFDSFVEAYDFYNLGNWVRDMVCQEQTTKSMQEIACGCSVRMDNCLTILCALSELVVLFLTVLLFLCVKGKPETKNSH